MSPKPMSSRLAKLTALLLTNAPATADSLADLERCIGGKLPSDYRQYLLASDGGEGALTGSLVSLRLYPTDQIADCRQELPDAPEDLWWIGDDGGDTHLLLDCRGPKPQFAATGDSDYVYFAPVASTFSEFLNQIAKLAPVPKRKRGDPTKGVALPAPGTPPPVEIGRIEMIVPDIFVALVVCLDPAGNRVFTSQNNNLIGWEIPSGKRLFELRSNIARCGQIFQITGDGMLLTHQETEVYNPASGCGQCFLNWRDAATGKTVRTVAMPQGCRCISGVSAAADIALGVTGGDGAMAVDLRTGKALAELPERPKARWPNHSAKIPRLFPSGRLLVVGNLDNLSVMTVPDFEEVCTIRVPDYLATSLYPYAAAVAPDESSIVIPASYYECESVAATPMVRDPAFICFDLRTGGERYRIPIPYTAGVYWASCVYAPDGKTLLATFRAEGKDHFGIYDAATGAPLRTIAEDRLANWTHLLVSADGNTVVTYDQFGKPGDSLFIRIWQIT